jgi:hypothetical protein
MLWLSTTDTSEVSEDLNFRITWEPAGFGFYRMTVSSGGERIAEVVKCGFDEARDAARRQCWFRV